MPDSNNSSKTLLSASNRQSIAMGSHTTIRGAPDISDAEKGTNPIMTPPQRAIQRGKLKTLFTGEGMLAPFRLLKSDLIGDGKDKQKSRMGLYHTDWGFNQLVLASAVFVFFTNLLPGITFASDLYVLTGKNYGTIEVVFSTGLCGIIFAL